MRKVVFMLALFFLVGCIAASSFALTHSLRLQRSSGSIVDKPRTLSRDIGGLTVRAKSISSGIYEDGNFTPSSSSFEAIYTINEKDDEITLDKIIENNRLGRMDEKTPYEITANTIGTGLSSLVISQNKKGQNIITSVRDSELGASEIFIIGDDFYEYCSGKDGKFYLEYGSVKKEK